MILACHRTRRTIEEAAALGVALVDHGAVASHTARCQRCHEYAADLAQLSAALGASLPHVAAHETLTDRIVSNLEIRKSAARPGLVPAPAVWGSVAAATAAIALWVFWPAAAPVPAHPGATGQPARHDVAAVAPPAPASSSAPLRIARNATPPARPAERVGVRPAPRRRSGAGHTTGQRARLASAAGTTSSAQWVQLGQCYAQWGDPLRAARAYGCAMRISGTADAGLAAEAGRAAETGGDVGTALDYYIRALDSGRPNAAAEQKGSLLWHDDGSPKSSPSYS